MVSLQFDRTIYCYKIFKDMKNRLQFNRHFPIFSGETRTVGGKQVWISGREQANEWLDKQIKRTDFKPLIGEPIVLRYLDDAGKKQLILAIGKATGTTSAITTQREYHTIDSAELKEGVLAANESAEQALGLASAATKDIANYRVILKNMIGDNGIELLDGNYFDTDDPSGCGLYKVYPGTNFISAATTFAKADYILDQALGATDTKLAGVEEKVNDVEEKLTELSGATTGLGDDVRNLSAGTVSGLEGADAKIEELSGVTASFSSNTQSYLENIIEGAGLSVGEHGAYPDHDDTKYIKDATSLDNADVILDGALAGLSGVTRELSANTIAAIDTAKSEVDGRIDELSAGTVSLSGVTEGLSANTKAYIDNVIGGAGLEPDGTYEHKHDAYFIDDAGSLFEADVLLDAALKQMVDDTTAVIEQLSAGTIQLSADTKSAIDDLSGNTEAAINEVSANTKSAIDKLSADTKSAIDELSANTKTAIDTLSASTKAAIDELSANTKVAIDEVCATTVSYVNTLSANTVAADQALSERIDALEGETISGEKAIAVSKTDGDTKVSLKIKSGEKILAQTTDDGLFSTLNLYYNENDKKIILAGIGNEKIAEVDATDFIKDGMLDDVRVFVATEEDQREHHELVVGETYIGLKFNTDAGKEEVFVSAKSLVDIYTVSATSLDYLTIKGYEIRANVDTETGLASASSVRELQKITSNIISGAGLTNGSEGGYPGHDDTKYIKDATSLDNADVILDGALWSVSGQVLELSAYVATSCVTKDYVDETVETLSGNVINYVDNSVRNLSGDVVSYVNNLSGDVVSYVDNSVRNISGDVVSYVNKLSGDVITYVDDSIQNVSGDVINYVNEVVSGLSGNVVTYVDESIETFSGAVIEYVNNMSAKTEDLTLKFNGELCGVYSPSAATEINIEATGADILLTGYEISTATTKEELAVEPTDTVNEAFGKVQKQIYMNEDAVAEALEGLESGLTVVENQVENNSEDIVNIYEILDNIQSGVSVDVALLSAATVHLSGVTNNITDNVTNLSAETVSILENISVLSSVTSGVVVDVETLKNTSVKGVAYDSQQKLIYLYDKDGEQIGEGVDATDFIKDGMLDDVAIEIISGETYLKFTFNTDAGKEDILIKVSDFAALYTGGDGIDITNDVVSVKLANKGDTDYIGVDGDGLYLSGISEIAENLVVLSGIVEENEYVVSAAINNLNERIVALEETVANLNTTVQNISETLQTITGSNEWFYNKLVAVLEGTEKEIKLTNDATNNKVTVGFADNAVFDGGTSNS